ncbi:hypothetical protein QYE76_020437 [Lolium multiflorum]|uniref:Peptidase S54 rhomboid domain-containing protein n=1 Tax=Lolium multiflorum TaxID=4521 RepID=A0AAD8R698_LOLMU|nr:hypothetical protein QYE76_020437 [Lolium multiflorum]
MAAMRKLLQQLQPAVAHHQAALRRATHCRLLHSTSPLAAASASPPDSPSPSPSLLPRSTGSILPTRAGAAVAAARTGTARSDGSLDEPLSLQLSRTTDWFASSSSTLLHGVGAPWAHWTTTPADDVVLMLAGANVVVYGLWRLADPKFRFSPSVIWLDMYTGGLLDKLLTSAHSYIDQRFMVNHFMISVDNFKSLRLHTLLTSAFSHIDAKHLFNNMLGLYFFGSSIAHIFGPAYLLRLYVEGAIFGSTFFLGEMIFLASRKEGFGGWNTPALGASAAVNATILLHIFMFPMSKIYLLFFIPLPAALVGAGLIGADLWRVKKGKSRVSGSAHLGGALVAALLFAEIKGWI